MAPTRPRGARWERFFTEEKTEAFFWRPLERSPRRKWKREKRMEKGTMKMKKILAWLMTAIMLASCAGAALAEAPAIPLDRLTVGNPTPMRGDFFTNLWGNDTSDMDVRELLHGYDLIYWEGENGLYTTNPTVVEAITALENREGDRTYVLVLHKDLYYSDGSPITAWDYAFTYLFEMAPEVGEIGGRPLRREQFLGYEEYISGAAKELAGVRVVADDTLMITVRHEYLPFFYELGLLICRPYPIAVIAPGVTVRDDGNGVYLANTDERVSEPVFTAELLRKTVLDPETGYLSHPSVVSGPYRMVSFDGTTAVFTVNPYYKGNAAGEKPAIETLTYTLAENESQMEKLAAGEFGLLNKVSRQDVINAGTELVGEGTASFSNYPRVGLTYFSFACERKTMASQAVRQAIAWCLDRDQLTAEYTGGYGIRVDGYYGIGQWMYSVLTGAVAPPVPEPENATAAERRAYEETLAAYEELNLDNLTAYTAEPERAAQLLQRDGWTLNAEGLRQKEIDGETCVLDLKMIYPEGNNINEVLERIFVPNLAQAGIRLTMEAVPMDRLLTLWYRQGERDMDMIYLGSNFDEIFDPAVHFTPDAVGAPGWAYTNEADGELYQLADAMRHTEPGDVLTYMQTWIRFQERFNETLPMLPVYSNIYFDFHTPYLRNYNAASSSSWAEAIVGAYLSEEEPEPEAEIEEGAEEFE